MSPRPLGEAAGGEGNRGVAILPPRALTLTLSRRERGRHVRSRRGQSLVEFAVVSLVVYMLLAAILTFGQMLYSAQTIQQAADVAAREISRTPLPATANVMDVLYSNNPSDYSNGPQHRPHGAVRSPVAAIRSDHGRSCRPVGPRCH